jgi:hypothetical protein
MEVENQVQLTNVSEVLIEHFHKCVNHFKHDEFILVLVYDRDKVQRCVSLVYDFVLFVFDEVAGFGLAGDYQLIDLD